MITDNRNKNYNKIYVKSKIKEELKSLNYNFKYLGTKYLIDSIYLLYSLTKYYKFSLESDVYPTIANKYGESTNVIKSNIVNATNMMFYDCDRIYLQNYIKDEDEDEYIDKNDEEFKPGPKNIIKAVLRRIKDI